MTLSLFAFAGEAVDHDDDSEAPAIDAFGRRRSRGSSPGLAPQADSSSTTATANP